MYSFLEQTCTDNFSFMYGNEESNENTSFFENLNATRIAKITRLMIGQKLYTK